MMDWSTDVSPSIIIPSTGIVSPGNTRSISSRDIFSAGIISSFPFSIFLPCTGAREIRFLRPFFALFVVISSSKAPKAIINTTSPAANKSPMPIAPNIAITINSADDILLMPGL